MQKLISPETKSGVLDVRQFGRNYWTAAVYATVTAAALAWPVIAGGNCIFYLILTPFGIGHIHTSLTDLRAAQKSEDRNAIAGNSLAILLCGLSVLLAVGAVLVTLLDFLNRR